MIPPKNDVFPCFLSFLSFLWPFPESDEDEDELELLLLTERRRETMTAVVRNLVDWICSYSQMVVRYKVHQAV